MSDPRKSPWRYAHQIAPAVTLVAGGLNCTRAMARLWLAADGDTGHWDDARAHRSLSVGHPILPEISESKRLPRPALHLLPRDDTPLDFTPTTQRRAPLKSRKRHPGDRRHGGASGHCFHLPRPEARGIQPTLPPSMPCEPRYRRDSTATPFTAEERADFLSRRYRNIDPIRFKVGGVRMRGLDLDATVSFGDDDGGPLAEFLAADGMTCGKRTGPEGVHDRMFWDYLERVGQSRLLSPALQRMAQMLCEHREIKAAREAYGPGHYKAVDRLTKAILALLSKKLGLNGYLVGRTRREAPLRALLVHLRAYTAAVGEYAAWIMGGECEIIDFEPESVPVLRLPGLDRGWCPLDISPDGPHAYLRTDRRSSYGKPILESVSLNAAARSPQSIPSIQSAA